MIPATSPTVSAMALVSVRAKEGWTLKSSSAPAITMESTFELSRGEMREEDATEAHD